MDLARRQRREVQAVNKKAYFDYEIIQEYEAGLVLTGTEVKSVRAGHFSIKEAFVKVVGGELWLINAHISPYEQGNINNHDPLRTRKLLVHKKELNYLAGKVQEQGLALVPLNSYIKGRKIKLRFGLAKGKKNYDKRRDMKEKDMRREMERALKGSGRD